MAELTFDKAIDNIAEVLKKALEKNCFNNKNPSEDAILNISEELLGKDDYKKLKSGIYKFIDPYKDLEKNNLSVFKKYFDYTTSQGFSAISSFNLYKIKPEGLKFLFDTALLDKKFDSLKNNLKELIPEFARIVNQQTLDIRLKEINESGVTDEERAKIIPDGKTTLENLTEARQALSDILKS